MYNAAFNNISVGPSIVYLSMTFRLSTYLMNNIQNVHRYKFQLVCIFRYVLLPMSIDGRGILKSNMHSSETNFMHISKALLYQEVLVIKTNFPS